jgi:hypothetical protein
MTLSRHIDHSTAQAPLPAPEPMHVWLRRHQEPRPGLLRRLFAPASAEPSPAPEPRKSGAYQELCDEG